MRPRTKHHSALSLRASQSATQTMAARSSFSAAWLFNWSHCDHWIDQGLACRVDRAREIRVAGHRVTGPSIHQSQSSCTTRVHSPAQTSNSAPWLPGVGSQKRRLLYPGRFYAQVVGQDFEADEHASRLIFFTPIVSQCVGTRLSMLRATIQACSRQAQERSLTVPWETE